MLTAEEREQVEQELANRQTELANKLQIPPLDNYAARARRAEWVRIALAEIERLERLLGVQHLRVVA